MQNPNEDTEWNDILRQHHILPAKCTDTNASMLKEECEDIALRTLRQKRIQDLKKELRPHSFEGLKEIGPQDFIREVSQGSQSCWVVLHLFKDGLNRCDLMNVLLNTLAQQYTDIQFLKIIGDQCIPNYPDQHLPTLLIYGEGDLKKQVIGCQHISTLKDMEDILIQLGAIQSTHTTIEKNNEQRLDEELDWS